MTAPANTHAEAPESALEALDFLAFLMVRNGCWEKARPLYEALATLDGNNRRYRQGLGYVLLQLDRPEEALAQLNACISGRDETPDPALVLLRARALWACGRKEEAREFLSHPERAAGDAW